MSGPRFIGRYQILDEVGRGGMGVVYRGVDPRLERTVAIKVLPPRKTASTKAIERFNREARVSARLDHPYIMKVFDVGEEDGTYYLVMEFVEGVTLRDVIGEDTPPENIDVLEMVRLFAQIVQALEYAHALHITHRDIKPENIMVSQGGARGGLATVKVMDFGLAVLDNRHDITQDNALMGTIAYLSPEQARGEKADHRADIYSLGVSLFEMLTGTLPFLGESPAEVLTAHMSRPAPSPRSLNSAISPTLERIVLGCLRKSPGDRFQSVEEIREQLESFRREIQVPSDYFWGAAGIISGSERASAQAPPQFRAAGSRPLPDGLVERRQRDLGPEARGLGEGARAPEWRPGGAPIPTGSGASGPLSSPVEVSPLSSPYTPGMPSDLARRLGPGDSGLTVRGTVPADTRTAAGDAYSAPPSSTGLPEARSGALPTLNFGGGADLPPASGLTLRVAPHTRTPMQPDNSGGGGASSLPSSGAGSGLESGAPSTGVPAASEEKVASTQWQQAAEDQDPWGRYQQLLSRIQKDEGEQAPSHLDSPSTVCTGCGAENAADRKFCSECGGLLTASSFQSAREAAGHLSQGLQHLEQGRLQDATYHFQQALLVDPSLRDAHKHLATVAFRQGDRIKAEEELRLALTSNPGDVEVLTELANLLRADGRKLEALGLFVEATRLVPEDTALRCHLAFLYVHLGDTLRATEEYRTVLAYDANSIEARFQLGILYASQNLVAEAIAEFELVARLQPSHARAYQWLGQLQARRSRFGDAERAYHQALEANGGDADTYAQLGALYEHQQREDLAVRQLRNALALDPGHLDSHLRLAALQIKHKQAAPAIRQLEQALTYHPAEVSLHQQLGNLYFQANRLDKAIEHFEATVRLDSATSDQHKRLGEAYLRVRDHHAQSIVQFQKAVALEPRRPELHQDLGMAYLAADQPEPAIKELKIAQVLDARNVEYSKAIGVLCERQGRLGEAEEYIKKALALNPRDAECHGLLGRIYGAQQMWHFAELEFTKSLELQPENQLMHVYLAQVLVNQGRPDKAVEHYKQAAALIGGREDLPELRRGLARSYLELARRHLDRGDLETAAEALESAKAYDAQDPRTLHCAGLLKQAQGDLKGARELFAEAIKREPQNPEVLIDLASLDLKRGEPEVALKVGRQVISMHPTRVEGYLRCSEALEKLSRFDEALEVLRPALAMGPRETAKARMRQGEFYCNQERWQKAAGEYQLATEADRWQWKAYVGLARALEELGRARDAMAEIEKALQLPVKDAIRQTLQETLDRLRLQGRR